MQPLEIIFAIEDMGNYPQYNVKLMKQNIKGHKE